MKNHILILIVLLSTTVTIAQSTKPKFEKQDDLVKATYFYEDGSIKQVGFFASDKLHGEWISYDKYGKKTTIAQYQHGKKTGDWLVLTDGIVKQITYNANKVIDVKDLKEIDLAFTD